MVRLLTRDIASRNSNGAKPAYDDLLSPTVSIRRSGASRHPTTITYQNRIIGLRLVRQLWLAFMTDLCRIVDIRVQLDRDKCPYQITQLPPTSARELRPPPLVYLALAVALIIIMFRIGQQYRASLKILPHELKKTRSSFTNVCRKFLPANCPMNKCILDRTTFSEVNCQTVAGYGLFERLQLIFGHSTFFHSPEKVANLRDLVQSLSSLKRPDPAGRRRAVHQLLNNEFTKQIVCVLQTSVWRNATLSTVYNRIGGGGCTSVTRQLIGGLQYLISTIAKHDKNGTPDENVVAAIRFVIGSIPLAAECCQLVDPGRVEQFIEDLSILREKEDR